jgi:hypothetical protein
VNRFLNSVHLAVKVEDNSKEDHPPRSILRTCRAWFLHHQLHPTTIIIFNSTLVKDASCTLFISPFLPPRLYILRGEAYQVINFGTYLDSIFSSMTTRFIYNEKPWKLALCRYESLIYTRLDSGGHPVCLEYLEPGWLTVIKLKALLESS